MDVKLYKTTAEKNALNKLITNEIIKNGHLKDNCDILNPVIVVNYDASILSYNYARIDAFNRFYFISDISINKQTIELTLKVDVLTTYSGDIKNSYATIIRSNKGSKMIPDNRITQKVSKTYTTRKLGAGLIPSDTYVIMLGGK